VLFDQSLRERTKATIQHAFALLELGQMPRPLDHVAKCRDCSLEPICLPRETLKLLKEDER
jgi:CRISPR-associated exonuclease Cas4